MARTTLATEMLWRSLREQRLVLSTGFWSLLNKCFLNVLSDIQQTLESCPDAVPAPVSGRIVIQIEKMIVLFRQFKTSLNPADSSANHIVIPSDVRALMAHYLGNDLQRMLWLADEGGSDSRAIILECAGEIKAFFIRLRAETGETAS